MAHKCRSCFTFHKEISSPRPQPRTLPFQDLPQVFPSSLHVSGLSWNASPKPGRVQAPLPGCAQGCAQEQPRGRACLEAGFLSVPGSSLTLEATCPPKRESFFLTAFLEALWPKPDQSDSFPETFPPILRKTGRLSVPSSLRPGARGGVPKESQKGRVEGHPVPSHVSEPQRHPTSPRQQLWGVGMAQTV